MLRLGKCLDLYAKSLQNTHFEKLCTRLLSGLTQKFQNITSQKNSKKVGYNKIEKFKMLQKVNFFAKINLATTKSKNVSKKVNFFSKKF